MAQAAKRKAEESIFSGAFSSFSVDDLDSAKQFYGATLGLDVEETEEGCLSVPGYFDKVTRAEKIRVRALDRDGKQIEFAAEGLLAVCIQHEIDHLDGKLFVDYLSELKRTRIRKKLEKERKERGPGNARAAPKAL